MHCPWCLPFDFGFTSVVNSVNSVNSIKYVEYVKYVKYVTSPMSTCFTQEGINIWCCYICAVSVSCLHALRTIGRCFFIWNQSNASTFYKDFLAYRKNRTEKKKNTLQPLTTKTMTKVPVRLALWAECADATAHLCASMTINAQCSFPPAT